MKRLYFSGSRKVTGAGIDKVKQVSTDGAANIKKLKVKTILISALAFFALLLVATNIFQPKAGTNSREGEPASKHLSHCDVCDGLGSTCPNCRGGICPDCNGAGYYKELDGYKNGQPVYRGPYACQTCDGSGKCPVCGGKKDCTVCNGTGYKLKYTGDDYCKTCRGSGICSKCLGEGQCRQCSGSGIVPQYGRQPKECTYCHGTGACSANCNNGYCAKCNGTGKV